MKKRVAGPIFIIVFCLCFLGFVKLNKWIQGEVSQIDKVTDASKVEPISKVVKEAPKPKKETGEVICQIRLAPERTFERSIFYQGGDEIARHKLSLKGIIYDHSGNIPNGRVKFINETNRTYGVEYYRDNTKHGLSKTNYYSGQLKIEAEYQYGQLMTRKEYFLDGTLKLDEDYSDAREYMDNRDVGDGKLYGRDGSLKYEWHLVNSDPNGYYKTYNRQGELTHAVYFDEFGAEKLPQTSAVVSPPVAQPAVSASQSQ